MKNIFYLLAFALLLGSCTVNKDIMFKTPADFAFDDLPPRDSLQSQIAPNDRLEFRLLTNDGYQLIEVAGERGNANNNQQAIRQFGITYLVEQDGLVKLPTLGRVQISGLTIKEAEIMLEERYSKFYNDPYIQLAIINNRVLVSPGDGGEARIVNIDNNMTVIEVLARAGGIANRGNSSKIKVIRDFGDHRDVYQIDLSTVETMHQGYMIVQANDIVYVEPTQQLAREVLQDVTPIISLLTSALVLISLFNR